MCNECKRAGDGEDIGVDKSNWIWEMGAFVRCCMEVRYICMGHVNVGQRARLEQCRDEDGMLYVWYTVYTCILYLREIYSAELRERMRIESVSA